MRGFISASRLWRTVLILQLAAALNEFPAKSKASFASKAKSSGPSVNATGDTWPKLGGESANKVFNGSTYGETTPELNNKGSRQLPISIAPTKCKQANGTSNCTRDGKQKKKQTPPSDKLTIGEKCLVCGFAFTFIAGVSGNAFVCYVFGYKQRKHRSVTETLFLYLGIVDLLASVVNPMLFTYWTVTRYSRWDFGIVGCKILAPLAPITITISATIIIIISLDRYRAIVSPFKGRYSRKQINIFVSIAVVLSIVSYTQYIFHLEVIPNRTCLVASSTALANAVPYVVVTLVRDVGYIILFCFTSIVIFNQLKVNERLQVNTDYLRKRRRDSRRICLVLTCVGVVFAILVFPKDVLVLVSTISWMSPPGINHTQTVYDLNAWFKVLNTSNSCVNVFIYSHMHVRFKRELRALFAACCKGRFTANEASTTIVTDEDYAGSFRRKEDESPRPIMMKSTNHDNNRNYKSGIIDDDASMTTNRGSQKEKKEMSVSFAPGNEGCSEADVLIHSEHA